jgi:predicted TPR repeat methyltransferase
MDNLQTRAEFWAVHHKADCQGGTPVLVDRYTELFHEKHVLEVGPGEGRQFQVVSPLTASYAVADISSAVLEQPIYSSIEQHHLKSFHVNLLRKWDVIHAWYVVHHMLRSERVEFFQFVRDHLMTNGTVIFNIPGNLLPGEDGEDGMRTTAMTSNEVEADLSKAGLMTLRRDEMNVFICQLGAS